VHVVWLTHNYPRFPEDIAGAFLHPLAAALVRRGVEVTVIAPSDAGSGGRGEDASWDGVQVRRVRYAAPSRERYAYTGQMQQALRSPAGMLALARLVAALRGAARSQAAQVVHAHWWVPAGLAAPPERPLVLTIHGTDARLLRSAAVRLVARRVVRRARVVTAVSQAVAQAVVRAMGAQAAVPAVQPMPLNTEGWAWSSGGGGAMVVARLTPQKRVHLAVEAVALLRAEGRALPLTIVGDGPERSRLEARAAALGLGGLVRFRGAAPRVEVRRALECADVFLLPAQEEGFGLAAAEALMHGVPVVACHDGGGLLDLVPPVGAGRLAAPEPRALAAAVRDVLDTPSARDEARAAGARWRNLLAPDAVAARFETWYHEAAGA
jgi:glycosyltransferase involved in cell wall biosynthesis